MNTHRRTFLFLAALAVAAMSTGPLWAQGSPKTRGGRGYGSGFWNNRAAQQSTRHARSVTGNVYRYSAQAPRMAPQYLRMQSEEVGRSLESAHRHLQMTREEAHGNQPVLKILDRAEGHLKKATEHHQTMHKTCCQKDPHGNAVMACCENVLGELEQCLIEQQKAERLFLKDSPSHEHTDSIPEGQK